MTGFCRDSRCRWPAVALLLIVVLGGAGSAQADARANYLIRLLQGSSQFRVRAQAAISLGTANRESQVVSALSKALADEHPAVRTAAATSLGRMGDPAALAALRQVASDPEPPVRLAVKVAIAKLSRRGGAAATAQLGASRGPPRFYIAIGRPATQVREISQSQLSGAQTFIEQVVSRMDGVLLAPSGESHKAAKRVLKKQRMKGYYIETAILKVEQRPGGGTRVAVSLIVATYPGRDMKAIMKGAATAMGSGDSTYKMASEAALNSALRKLPTALGL